MEDSERFRLLGKYRTPRFRIGRTVFCEVRGEMVITGMTDAPIPWPVGKKGRGRHSLIVFKDLAKAVRRESNQAVAHWVERRSTDGDEVAQDVERGHRDRGDAPPLQRTMERTLGYRGAGQGTEQSRRPRTMPQDR